MSKFPIRGEIYWIKLDPVVGHEIGKMRPGLIVSNNVANKVSNRIIVAPITSSVKDVYPFEVKIQLNEKFCKILLDQVRSVDKIRLGSKVDSLDIKIMDQVDIALKIALDLI